MVKKAGSSLVAALFCVMMPVMANASSWTLNTWVKSGGGYMTSRNNAAQTSANGSVFKSYTTHAPLPVSVTANSGYMISNVTMNGTDITGQVTNNGTSWSGSVQGMNSQSVYATFAAQAYSLTATAGSGGTVSPTSLSNIYYGNQANPVTVTFSPNTGFNVQNISMSGVGNATCNGGSCIGFWAANTSVQVKITNVTGNVALAGTFQGPPIANAGAPQTVLPSTLVTLGGSSSTGNISSYNWIQTGGPVSVSLTQPVNITDATFIAPTVTGTYNFSLTVTGGSTATTSVYVSNDPAASAYAQCQSCHNANSVGTALNVYGNWSSSQHRANLVMCSQCHIGTNTGGHPGTVNTSTVSPTTFTLTGNANGYAAGTNFCAQCHSNANQIVSAYNASPHPQNANGPTTCSGCHGDAHAANATTSPCMGCHCDSYGNVSGHPFAIGGNSCISCHDPHSTAGTTTSTPTTVHYNNITTGMYPASYVTSRAQCVDCHYDDSATTNLNATRRHEWAKSGHAATTDLPWIANDFKTMVGCVQCHTATGFIAYSTGKVTTAWGTASDKTKEVLACNGCHKDITTGTIRTATPIRPFADDTYTNHNVGESNVCMDCHSGTNSGQSITAKLNAIPAADFTNRAFIDPHYLAAGGTLQGKIGYHFPGQTYAFYSTNTHRTIGVGNSNGSGTGGPCVACHKNPVNGHTFVAGFQNGAIPLCANCHGTSLPATALAADQADFANALGVLRAELTVKGFVYYSSATPRFPATNWGAGQAGANTMGAAFNYALLRSEPGAYAHNSAYAKQLILDSIDYLYNGTLTGDITTALTSLVNSGAITQQASDSLTAYRAKTSCTTCHNPATTGSHPAHLSDGLSCAECHNTTAATSTTLVPGTTTHLNGTVDVVITPLNNGSGGANFNPAANSCSGVTCHGNGTATVTWGSGPVACVNCHTGTLAVINGITAPDGSLAATTGHGQTGIGLQCLDCHDSSQRHLGGSGMLQSNLTGAQNNECNSCHSAFPQLQTCPVCLNLSACADCHDPHGTSNLGMIRTSILGRSITFTDSTYGFINTVTNQGLCQVCHTTTAHYRAGVPERSHYTSDCLSCHGLNGSGGTVTLNACNSCHGYPPAPKAVTTPVNFGTMNNWSSARFEDYSGGGGAHLLWQHISPSARASEGWVNCTMCHNGGRTDSAPYHQMKTPVSTHISNVHIEVDPQYRFADGFTIYTGARLLNPPAQNATGSCFNISCHMNPSQRWSIER